MAKVILTGNYKMMSFNSSRHSAHSLTRAIPIPLRKIWHPLDGVSMCLPVWENYQVIHSFNRIPFVQKPWIVTFESFLPRTLGVGNNTIKAILRERLILNNCKKIIAISHYAKNKFIEFNKDWDFLNDALNKLVVTHPNISLKTSTPKTYCSKDRLKILFVGNDFARKGGIVALRLAKKAKDMGLPITVSLVSGMNYGSKVYTDHPNASRYEKDLKLLHLDNVVFYKKKSNQEVIQLLSENHFHLMATLDDTYGFSVLEGFSTATPAITTNVCALQEIVHHRQNGYVLNLDLNEEKKWRYLFQRQYREYWDILDTTYNNLVEQALHSILEVFNKPEDYERLSAGAIAQVLNLHDSQKTSELLDSLYSEIMSETT